MRWIFPLFLTRFLRLTDDVSRSSEVDFKEWFENSTYHLSAFLPRKVMVCGENNAQLPPPHALAMIQLEDSTAFPDPCRNFTFPPPPPRNRRRIGPRRKCKIHFFPTQSYFLASQICMLSFALISISHSVVILVVLSLFFIQHVLYATFLWSKQ